MSVATLFILSLLAPCFGMPTNREHLQSLVGRDGQCNAIQPFEGSLAAPTEYYNGQPGGCPIKNTMDSQGRCGSGFPKAPDTGELCAGYCEVKVSFFWGQEVPINEFGGCSAHQACEYTTTQSLAITQTFEFNAGISLGKRDDEGNETLEKREDAGSSLKAAFNIGASYSYSDTKTTSNALALHRPDNTMEWCGHWTFVPVFLTSCGSMTTVQSNWNALGGQAPNCIVDDSHTTGNYCNTSPYLDKNGNQAGQPIFVLVDCNTKKLAPKEKQDPIYQYNGVSVTGW